jgi:universal stress protein A
MIHILPESMGSLICIKVSGKLTDAEYKNFIPKVESVINEFGAIKLYVDMLDMDGWEWRVAWDDFAFGIKHWNNFTKLALVGEKRWEKFSAQVADKINKAEVRFFDRKETTEALIWIKD